MKFKKITPAKIKNCTKLMSSNCDLFTIKLGVEQIRKFYIDGKRDALLGMHFHENGKWSFMGTDIRVDFITYIEYEGYQRLDDTINNYNDSEKLFNELDATNLVYCDKRSDIFLDEYKLKKYHYSPQDIDDTILAATASKDILYDYGIEIDKNQVLIEWTKISLKKYGHDFHRPIDTKELLSVISLKACSE